MSAPAVIDIGGRFLLAWGSLGVPWVTAWSAEVEPALAVLPDGSVLFSSKRAPGVGRPVFALSHVSRVYQALTGRLCGVCGEPMPEGWVFAVPMDPPGLTGTVELAEPPAHEGCLRYACVVCPALVERKPPIWGFMGWRVITRLRGLPAPELAAVRASLPPHLATRRLVTEVVYAVEGPVRHVSYDAFRAGPPESPPEGS